MPKLIHPQTWASLSVSECESASALGLDSIAFNNLIYRFSEFLLNRGFRMLFGHDWRADGVMRIVAELAESRASSYHKKMRQELPRMLNLVPQKAKDFSRHSAHAAEESHGLLEVVSLYSLCPGNNDVILPQLKRVRRSRAMKHATQGQLADDPVSRLWFLRQALTEISRSGIRICLGGKTQGYSGAYAGIAEEAYFACNREVPLYLVAGFGGTSAEVAACFSTKPKQIFRSKNRGKPLLYNDDIINQTNETLAEKLGIPLDNLAPWFKNYSIEKLAKNNGLTPEENELLFRATDIEVVLHLLEKAFGSLQESGKLRGAT